MCFRYVGDAARPKTCPTGEGAKPATRVAAKTGRHALAGQGFSPADEERLDRLNQELRERFNRSGEGWITTTALGGRRVLRVTVMNPRTTSGDLVRVLDGLAALGATVAQSQ